MLISDQKAKHILDLGFKIENLSLLNSYLEMLVKKNKEINLFSRKISVEELIDNHVIDCLLPLEYFPKSLKAIADFGSGGGFPGVIYAIHFKSAQFYLYEKSNLKRAFLESLNVLSTNVKTCEFIESKLPPVDLITSRAFKSIVETIELSTAYFNSRGKYYFLKGRAEKINEEIKEAMKKFKDIYFEVVKLKSPVLDVERHLVILFKK